ncbi:MAG: penicillin-binding protein 1A [Gammaproteobacteria bacterium]|jgi:penicillin-binding protein 1A|nr:penicillin-binding protein 1A [Gammaproteobacteria bacterium]
MTKPSASETRPKKTLANTTLVKLSIWALRLAFTGVVIGILGLAATWLILAPDLPEVDMLADVQLQSPLIIETADRSSLSSFGEKRRIPIALSDIPPSLRNAFIASEDDRFYSHPGIDWQGIARAVFELLRTGQKGQGGSTITMQLARGFFLSSDKTYVRKLKEIMLSLKMERELSKDQILQLYLNKIYLGHRAYGVAAAAQVYYGKPLAELTLAESAMIAGITQRPSKINPITNPPAATARRNYVLTRMHELDIISDEQYQQAYTAAVTAFRHQENHAVSAPYLAEMARAWAVKNFGTEVYESGMRIVTTIDTRNQLAANQALRQGLMDYDRRHGYRGPEAHVDLNDHQSVASRQQLLDQYQIVNGMLTGLVLEADAQLALVQMGNGQTVTLDLPALAWARPMLSVNAMGKQPESVSAVLQAGDLIRVQMTDQGGWELAQVPEVQGAIISLDPTDGAVLALSGGFDFYRSKFNRAIQAQRQPGSSFKPFIYATAIDSGYSPASVVNDAPVVFRDGADAEAWKPQNFSRSFYGPTRLREAMTHSRNLISVRLLEDIGIQPAIDSLERFGFDPQTLPRNLSMALGSANLSPMQLAQGYAMLANGGYQVQAYWLREIRDQANNVLLSTTPVQLCERCPAIDEQTIAVDSSAELLDVSTTSSEINPQIGLINNADQRIRDTAPILRRLFKSNGLEGPPLPAYRKRAIDASTVYLTRSMMASVIKAGTGRRAMVLGRSDLAGKTGTTNEQRDAWFSGFNSDVVTTVWTGFDDFSPLGKNELGGVAALPIWIDYMRVALSDSEDRQPSMPAGVAQVWIDAETGKLADAHAPGAIPEVITLQQLTAMRAQKQNLTEEQPAVDPFGIN